MILFLSKEVLGRKAVPEGQPQSDVQWVLCSIECDTFADLPTYNQFEQTDNILILMGSKAHVIATNKFYKMQSNGSWIQQTQDSTISIDAENVNYDNTDSGLTADNVQDAIDELKEDNDTQDRALTELYAEDANQQVEINYAINTGCKNYCPYDNLTATQAGTILNDQPINLPSGTYILTFKYTATSGSSSFRFLNNGTSILNFTVNNTSTGTASREFTLDSDANQIRLYTSIANTYTDVMIRSKDVRNSTFQPYAPTNRELYLTKATVDDIYGVGTTLSATASDPLNADDLTQPGIYVLSTTAIPYIYNLPVTSTAAKLIVQYVNSAERPLQTLIPLDADCAFYKRMKLSGGWGDWKVFEGTTAPIVNPAPTLNMTRTAVETETRLPLSEEGIQAFGEEVDYEYRPTWEQEET